MGTLTSSTHAFSTIIFRFPLKNPLIEYSYRNRIPITTSGGRSCAFLCREIFRKRRRTSTRDFVKLMVIRSSHSNNDDSDDSSEEGEDKENSSLATAKKEEPEERRSSGGDKDFDSRVKLKRTSFTFC